MNTVTCPKCGKSFRGSTCPQCGCPINDEKPVIKEESVKEDPLPKNTIGESQKLTITGNFIKCSDCGKIYKTVLETCPQCGCPSERQTPKLTIDENTPIDISKLISIKEDKFEETKDFVVVCRKSTRCSIDSICQTLDTHAPRIILEYHVEKGIGQLRIIYYENEMLEKIESNQDRNLWDKYGSPCKRMIINIDERENIRLELEESQLYVADFPIDQELFLKCCNARKLEFKITKENGESIIIKGYYDLDPETGAEIDVNGDVMPVNDLILNFQVLYNYAIDSNVFTDALRKRQIMDEWYTQLITLSENKQKFDYNAKYKAVDEKQQGLLWLLVGIITTFLGIVLLLLGTSKKELSLDDDIGLIIIGVCMLVIGPVVTIYGGKRIKRVSSTDTL